MRLMLPNAASATRTKLIFNSSIHPLPKLSTQIYSPGSRPTVPFVLTSHNHRLCHFSAAPTSKRLKLTPRCEAAPSSNGSSPQFASLKAQGWLVSTPDTHPVRQDYDAILVLGGGLTPTGGLPPWVTRRLDCAQHIYSQQQNPIPILLLGAGTPHKRPVLDSAGFVLFESTAYARYLLDLGIPAKDLLKETSSYDTVGNAYFGLTMHALPAGWRKLSIITSVFHMPRTHAIFDSCFEIAGGDVLDNSAAFQLDYHPVSDEGLFTEEVIQARCLKEKAAVATWRQNVAQVPLKTVADLHNWIFATHLCYSVSRQHDFGVNDDMDPTLAATY